MKIERVQYDGEGEWLDVHFNDGRGWRIPAVLLRWFIDDNESEMTRPECASSKELKP